MTTVYHELLPESYLLILVSGGTTGPEVALDNSLKCASHSGKPAVWLDCKQLEQLSAEAAGLLWAYHHELEARHIRMVLAHVSPGVEQELLRWQKGAAPCIVPTLLDAARPVAQA